MSGVELSAKWRYAGQFLLNLLAVYLAVNFITHQVYTWVPSVATAGWAVTRETAVEGISAAILGGIAALLRQHAAKWVWTVPAILFFIAIGLPGNAQIRGEFFARGCAEAGDSRCTPYLVFTLEAFRGVYYSSAAGLIFWMKAKQFIKNTPLPE